MKTIRITLEKDGATAICTHTYRFTDAPFKTEWIGNRKPFSAEDGPLDFHDGIYNLARNVAHQAALCGATYKIEDLGGEAEMWKDNIILKADG